MYAKIAITSLREQRASRGAFRTFNRFALGWFCLFPLPLGVFEGLRFWIVSFPGLFSYPFVETLQEYSTDDINRRHFQMQVFLAF